MTFGAIALLQEESPEKETIMTKQVDTAIHAGPTPSATFDAAGTDYSIGPYTVSNPGP